MRTQHLHALPSCAVRFYDAPHVCQNRTPCFGRLYDALPEESRVARVRLLLPKQASSQDTDCVLHLAGTGDHGFSRRTHLAFPLIAKVFLGFLIHVIRPLSCCTMLRTFCASCLWLHDTMWKNERAGPEQGCPTIACAPGLCCCMHAHPLHVRHANP